MPVTISRACWPTGTEFEFKLYDLGNTRGTDFFASTSTLTVTFVEPAAVPEPSETVLFAVVGFISLLQLRRQGVRQA